MNHDYITEITSFISNPINNINIKLLKYTDSSMYFDIDSYPVKVIIDFANMKYCIAESEIDDLNINNFNLAMVFKEKKPLFLLDELTKLILNKNNESIQSGYSDPFHIYQKMEEVSKYMIDYVKLEKELEKFSEGKINNKTFENIPKNLLLSQSQIIKLIINEIKKVNRNKENNHYIFPDETNPYCLNVMFVLGAKQMHIKLILDKTMYPYVPPKLEYVKPKIKMPLLLALLNLDILKLENWNPTIDMEYFISNLGQQLEKYADEYFDDNNNVFEELEYELVKFASVTKETSMLMVPIKISVPKATFNETSQSGGKYWKSGTGYGTEGVSNWDIKAYIKEQEIINIELGKSLEKINDMITDENFHIISSSVLINYVVKYIKGLSLLEIDKNKCISKQVFNILANIITKPLGQNIINMVASQLKDIFDELDILAKANVLNDEFLLEIYTLSDYYLSKYVEHVKEIQIASDIKEQYCMTMKKLQMGNAMIKADHRYYSKINTKLSDMAKQRVLKEFASFSKGLPLNWESSIWVRMSKDNINLFTFLISGPKDTPYENGLFEFHAYFPPDYPNTTPEVLIHTTGNNTVRFNPNLYNTGKVCLSLLGTWQGSESEKWNASTSSFLQVLVSIQSLILIEQPYFNEPGWEREMNTPKGKQLSKDYNEEREPHTINLAMTEMILNPPIGFEDVVMNHFKMKKEEIINRTLIWEQNATKHLNLITENRKKLIKALEKF